MVTKALILAYHKQDFRTFVKIAFFDYINSGQLGTNGLLYFIAFF